MGKSPGKRKIHTFELYGDDIRNMGHRLRDMRRKAGMTQRQVADEMCCCQSHVSAIECGEGDLRLSTIIRYAEALGMDTRVAFAPHTYMSGR